MTVRLYSHIRPGEPTATLNPGNGDPFAVVQLGDASHSYMSFHTVQDVLPHARALAAALRLLDPENADNLLFDALFGDDALAKIRARIAIAAADVVAPVPVCSSCGLEAPRGQMRRVTNADTGEDCWFCADPAGCGRRALAALSGVFAGACMTRRDAALGSEEATGA